MLLVTVDELETHLGAAFSPEDRARAEQAITMASAAIQRYCNLVGLQQVTDTVVLRGVYGTDLLLPFGPVAAVSAVEVDGQALGVNDYDVVRDELVRRAGWGGTSVEVEVTYTHGLAVVPDEVKAVCLDVAARSYANPTGVRSETIDGYSVTYAGAGAAVGLWPGDRSSLSAFHRSAASVLRS